MAAGETINLAAFSNAMKVNAVFEQQFKQYLVSSFLLNNIQRRSGRVRLGGRTMEVSLETRGMASFGAIDELEPIVEPDMPGFALAEVPIRNLTSRFQISLQAHLASQRERDAWVSSKMRAMSSTVEMFGQNLSRLLHGTGSGALARVDSIAAGPPIVITLFPDQGATATNTFGTKYMIKGLRLSADTALTGKTVKQNVDLRVTAVDKDANTITVTGDITGLAANDYLFLGSKERTSKNRCPVGIMGYIDDGSILATVLNINRTTSGNEYFQAHVNSAVGGADLENEFQKDIDEVYTTHGGRTDLIMTSMGVWRRFSNDLRGDRRFVTAAETGRYKGGTRMLMFGGAGDKDVPIVRDRDVPTGTAWGFDWDCWYLGTLLEAGWLQQFDEKSIFRWVQDHLAYEAVYTWMGECVCVVPGKQWREDGITEA